MSKRQEGKKSRKIVVLIKWQSSKDNLSQIACNYKSKTY